MGYDFKSLTRQADEASNRNKFYIDFEDVDPTVLHQITDLTEWIRTKGKGSDVREIIAQLFERTWLEAMKEGNANLEVAKSRGDFDLLPDRLDSMAANLRDKAPIEWVKEQLENMTGGGPIAVLQDLPAIQAAYPNGDQGIVVAKGNGHWYFWSNSARQWQDGGLYKAQGLDKDEVSADNVDFTSGIKQMLDLDSAFQGKVHSWAGTKMSDYPDTSTKSYPALRLLANKTYYLKDIRGVFSYYVSLDGKRMIRKFSEKEGVVTTDFTPSEDGLLYITAPAGKTPQVFSESLYQLRSSGVDLNKIHRGYISIKIPKLELEVDAEDLSFIRIIKQLLDESAITRDVYYTGNKQGTATSASWGVYPPVFLKSGETYGLHKVRGFFTYFMSTDDQLVKKFATSDRLVSEDFTPSQDGYLLVTRRLADESSKLISGGLSKATMLPSLDYGALALETDVPFVPKENKTDFTVKKDGSGDFVSLVAAINSLGEGTPNKPFNIYIHSGEYNILEELGGDQWLQTVERTNSERLGIVVPDYVNIIGVGDVRLYLEVPDDKTTVNSAKRISLLNVWKHNTIRNLKMYVRNTRYAIHDETNNSYHGNDVRYIDCYLEHKGNKAGVWQSTQAYAAGTGSNGNYLFENCTFKSATIPFSMHDNENQDGNTIKIKTCQFISGSDVAIRFGSHGSNTKQSKVTIENCNIDKAIHLLEERAGSRVGNHFKVTGGGNTIVPYINVNSAGRKERVEFGDEVRVLRNSGQSEITIGTPVKLSGSTVQPLGADEPWLFYGVALDTIAPGATGVIKYRGYIAKEDTGLSALSAGQKIGLVGGRLAVVTDGDFIGYATDSNNVLLRK